MAKSCYHCALPIPINLNLSLSIADTLQYFCCPGCLAISEFILGNELELYYVSRENPGLKAQELSEHDKREFAAYKIDKIINEVADKCLENNAAHKITLMIANITCAACLWLIETKLKRLVGVKTITVNLVSHKAEVSWDNAEIKLGEIMQEIHWLGYKARIFSYQSEAALLKQQRNHSLKRLLVSALGSMQVMMFAVGLYAGELQGIEEQYKYFLQLVSLFVSTPVVLYTAKPIVKQAISSIASNNITMDVPVSIAITLAYFSSVIAMFNKTGDIYFDSVCMFIFFITLSKHIQLMAQSKARSFYQKMQALLPTSACVICPESNADQTQTKLVKDLTTSDLLYLRDGDSIPVDAVVVAGSSQVDEAILTGEAQPVKKTIGSKLLAGSCNIEGTLTAEVTHLSNNSYVAKLSQFIEKATSQKPRVILLANRIAIYFSCALLLVATLTYVSWSFISTSLALKYTLAVLIVACPCALALATPVALTVAIHNLAAKGLLVSNANIFATLAEITTVVFDKTGTLTKGELIVTKIKFANNIDRNYFLQIAKTIERTSNHPIAKAITRYCAIVDTLECDNIKKEIGAGIEVTINNKKYRIGKPTYAYELLIDKSMASEADVMLCNEQQVLIEFYLKDTINSQAQPLISRLSDQDIATMILSGDSYTNTQLVANQIDVGEFAARKTPAQKLAIIQSMQNNQEKVLLVADGINDSLALAAADAAIVVEHSADLLKINADAMLTNSNLMLIYDAILLAKRTQANIRFNIYWALFYNFSAVALAAFGYIPPYLAAAGMSLSSIFVVLNAMRLAK